MVFIPLLYLFLAFDMRMSFLIAYAIIGSTDFFDGKLARKLNQVTDIGKTLDSVCDLVFYLSTIYFFYTLFYNYIAPNNLLVISFLVIFASSFIISFIKTRKLIMMHTSLKCLKVL